LVFVSNNNFVANYGSTAGAVTIGGNFYYGSMYFNSNFFVNNSGYAGGAFLVLD
jgi:hypothetical protein